MSVYRRNEIIGFSGLGDNRDMGISNQGECITRPMTDEEIKKYGRAKRAKRSRNVLGSFFGGRK